MDKDFWIEIEQTSCFWVIVKMVAWALGAGLLGFLIISLL
jgi:hypothetical protein